MEKFNFNFSKTEDQKQFNRLGVNKKERIVESAHNEAFLIQAMAKELRGKSKKPLKSADYKKADDYIESLDSDDHEKIDTYCEVVARQHEFNLVHWKKPMAVRVGFSGMMDNTLSEGFDKKSFIFHNKMKSFDYSDTVNMTRNDAFDRVCRSALSKAFSGEIVEPPTHPQRYVFDDNGSMYKDENLAVEKYKDIVKEKFPEVYENLDNEERRLRQEIDKLKSSGAPLSERIAINSQYIDLFVNLQPLDDFFCDLNENQQDVKKSIVKNFFEKKPAKDWGYDDLDYFYKRFVDYYGNNVLKDFHDGQLYDIAYIVDPEKVDAMTKGYLPGNEYVISAKPESIEGYVLSGSLENLSDYFIDKAKKLFRTNPEFARPIYDSQGNLIWPDKMTSKEIDKKFSNKK